MEKEKEQKKKKEILILAQKAKAAAFDATRLTTEQKNEWLLKSAEAIQNKAEWIQTENQKDLEYARNKGLSTAMIDRLVLNDSRIQAMIEVLKEVSQLPDPIGQRVKSYDRPNGLKIERVRIPLGVIGIIYESRPNVTVDAASLCLKSGNVVVLRGGSEAFHSNLALTSILRSVLSEMNLNPDLIQILTTQDRAAIDELLQQDQYIDLIIPRGGPQLMKVVREKSKIPVVKHDKGVCHLFIDSEADLIKAKNIALNSKIHRPGVCNALETLLVDRSLVEHFLADLLDSFHEQSVEIRGCTETQKVRDYVKAATEEDWDAEYLDLTLAVKVVDKLEAAIEHIKQYTSLHTEVIVTENAKKAEQFLNQLHSSCVMVNASTRFNDGGQLGLGAEIGISTTKLHAFGPMGLEELTTTKFIVHGEGQIRE